MFNKFTNSRHILSFMFSQIQFEMKIRSIKFHFTDKFLIFYSSKCKFSGFGNIKPQQNTYCFTARTLTGLQEHKNSRSKTQSEYLKLSNNNKKQETEWKNIKLYVRTRTRQKILNLEITQSLKSITIYYLRPEPKQFSVVAKFLALRNFSLS